MYWLKESRLYAHRLQINANAEDEAGIGDELGIMGVREPGFRILTHEMGVKER